MAAARSDISSTEEEYQQAIKGLQERITTMEGKLKAQTAAIEKLEANLTDATRPATKQHIEMHMNQCGKAKKLLSPKIMAILRYNLYRDTHNLDDLLSGLGFAAKLLESNAPLASEILSGLGLPETAIKIEDGKKTLHLYVEKNPYRLRNQDLTIILSQLEAAEVYKIKPGNAVPMLSVQIKEIETITAALASARSSLTAMQTEYDALQTQLSEKQRMLMLARNAVAEPPPRPVLTVGTSGAGSFNTRVVGTVGATPLHHSPEEATPVVSSLHTFRGTTPSFAQWSAMNAARAPTPAPS